MKYKGNLAIDLFNSEVKTACWSVTFAGAVAVAEERKQVSHKHTHPHF